MKSPLDSVQFLKGVGPKRLEVLQKLGISTVRDLLFFLPRDYEDRTQITPIAKLRVGEKATVRASVQSIRMFRSGRGRAMAELTAADDTGVLRCIWFHTRYFQESKYPEGREMFFTGKVDFFKGPQIVSPQTELADSGEALFGPSILPIYPLTENLNQTGLRKVMKVAVEDYADSLPDMLPTDLLKKLKLPSTSNAIRTVHFPESTESGVLARKRLAYDELFLLEFGMALRRRGIRQADHGFAFDITPTIDKRIRKRFPFQLTSAQERAIAEIRKDMAAPVAMNRLLQGDVGSGKTVVALYAMLAAVANHHQAALMAPTEILATQHFQTIQRYLAGSRVRIALLVGGMRGSERKEMLQKVVDGEIDIVIGTHALVQGTVDIPKLALAVVDEQHKFGVIQRQKLRQKGRHPDVLVMTATPIPRTLALTVFGDLDVSVIDELPPGRQPVKSRAFGKDKLDAAYEFIRKHIARGEQAFFVYPLVEESEALDMKAATVSARHLQRDVFPELRIGLLHGRMKQDEKDCVMAEFRAGRYHILVSTIVIEVGIDIPNATIMVVEHAERFGLSQLHQLRGRIGRGDKPGYFLLLANPKNDGARQRLKVICSTTDGFRIAEEDLKLRGPGEFFGTRQHGLPELHIADIIKDYQLLRRARRDAFDLALRDPALKAPEHQLIRERLTDAFKNRLDLIHVG
jgi:ATP-dependent DNA helicase RecG